MILGGESKLEINASRLQGFIDQFAEIGATPNGGVSRLALSDEDKIARDLLVELTKKIGCTIRIDQIGNIFCRYGEKDTQRPAILIGSHGDSQPYGGKYDGIYGVLAGLEVLYTLHENNIDTQHPVELAMWTNEEGSRFAPPMIGSAVFSDNADLQKAYQCLDKNGSTIKSELQRIGYLGNDDLSNLKIHAALELHIEQGPVLEAHEKTIGIVNGAFGQKWFEISLTGLSAHAGATPMEMRQDALLGVAQIVQAIHEIGLQSRGGRATVGMVEITPNSRNVVPGYAWFSVEFRHLEESTLEKMEEALREVIDQTCDKLNLSGKIKSVLSIAPVHFDQTCQKHIQAAAEKLAYSYQEISSGAGHDACQLASIARTGMIFIPCIKGLSHNEAEAITPKWRDAGANVLLHTILSLDKA